MNQERVQPPHPQDTAHAVTALTRRLAAAQDAAEIRLALFESVFQVTGARQIALHLLAGETAASHRCDPHEAFRIAPVDPLADSVVRQLAADQAPRFWQRQANSAAAAPQTALAVDAFDSYIALPLAAAGVAVGVVEAFDLAAPENAARQTDTLRHIAAPASLAIHNNLLTQAVRAAQSEQERAAATITRLTADLDSVAASLQQTQAIVDASPVILFRWRSPDGRAIRFDYLSQNIAQFGYDRADFLQGRREWTDVILPEDLRQTLAQLQAYSVGTANSYTLQYRILTHTGDIRWIEDNSNIVRDERGRVAYYEGFVTDITERVAAEAEREHARAELARQARDLQIVTEVSARAASNLDPNLLLDEVVNLVKDRFDLYHTHIYLYDPQHENLVLSAAAGVIGLQMLDEVRSIPLRQTQSLVAGAARGKTAVIENDVYSNPAFLPHPLLPDTRAELAVPILAAEQLIGVLDVQSDKIGHFTPQDAAIQTTLAAQIGIAIENARSFTRAQRAMSDLNELTQSLTREGWENYLAAKGQTATRYLYAADQPDSGAAALRTGELEARTMPATVPLEAALAQPLNIRGQQIGQLAIVPETADVDAETAEIVAAVAEQLSARIENIRLAEQMQMALGQTEEQAKRLAALNDMAAALNAAKDEAEIFAIAAEQTLQIVRGDRVSTAQVHARERTATIMAAAGADVLAPAGAAVSLEGAGALATAVREMRIVSRQETAAAPDAVRSLLVVPLIRANTILGAINVGSTQPDAFDQNAENLLRQIATLVAATLENRQLLNEARQRARREQILRQITARVRSSADADTIMRVAVQEVGRTLGRKTVIYLDDSRGA